jgi:hypothetical protein
MARAVEQIERDMEALEQLVRAIAQEFHNTYSQYLTALGQALRRQVILACYHICTQGYPTKFLQLSFAQRQELQQALQQLARQAQTQLLEQLQLPSVYDEFELLESSEESDDESVEANFADLNASEEPMTPKDLTSWQEDLEQSIAEVLQDISHATNRSLQQTNILPSELPEPILEVAAKAGMATEVTAGPPNLLNLLIETETEDEESSLTHIMAVKMRLAEIEFGDATLTNWRSKIRSLSIKLNQLKQDYQKKRREKAIAEAETAWRASWYED